MSANFQYDPFGRRVAKTTVGTTQYLYDGVNPLEELSNGTPAANLLTGIGVDEYFQRTDPSGVANFLTDGLGSTTAVTGVSGNTLGQYTYEPFGNTSFTGSSANPYQYTGRENDATGLYFYRTRYYNPHLGRFLSEDPAGFIDGTNLYTYVGANPVSRVDPLGLAGTFSLGGTFNLSLGFVNFQYSGGFVVDSSGNIGVYNTYTPLPGSSFGFSDVSNVGSPGSPGYYPFGPRPGSTPVKNWSASLGVSSAVSNASSICQLGGPFVNGSFGGGEGLVGSVDSFAGSSSHGPVVGLGGTLGGGIGSPAKGFLGVTTTTITSLAGRKQCQ